MTIPVAIPIRSFQGMERLAGTLDDATRRELSISLADRVADAVAGAGARVRVVTGDFAVATWARARGYAVLAEPAAGGLNAAATAAMDAAHGAWAVIHGDLPMVTSDDVEAVLSAMGKRPVLAPSKDCGTSMVAGRHRGFPFRFGAASFIGHLAALRGEATVVVRPGLAIDIDRPEDLAAIVSLRDRR